MEEQMIEPEIMSAVLNIVCPTVDMLNKKEEDRSAHKTDILFELLRYRDRARMNEEWYRDKKKKEWYKD